MKKFFAIAIVAVAFTACNNSAEETKTTADSAVKAIDSTVSAVKDSVSNIADSAAKKIDSTASAVKDSVTKKM